MNDKYKMAVEYFYKAGLLYHKAKRAFINPDQRLMSELGYKECIEQLRLLILGCKAPIEQLKLLIKENALIIKSFKDYEFNTSKELKEYIQIILDKLEKLESPQKMKEKENRRIKGKTRILFENQGGFKKYV